MLRYFLYFFLKNLKSDLDNSAVIHPFRIKYLSEHKMSTKTISPKKIIEWFNKKYGVNQKFETKIKKTIPVGAGLGGGSSNAAIALRFLAKFHNIQIKDIDNTEIALALGADVPVFVHKKSCYASGIGDILGKSSFNSSEYLLICPQIFVSTQNLYQSTYLEFQNIENKEINSFLPVLIKENEEFKDFYGLLRSQLPNKTFEKLKLSGTGSTLFLQNPSESEKEIINEKIGKNFRIFLAKGLEY